METEENSHITPNKYLNSNNLMHDSLLKLEEVLIDKKTLFQIANDMSGKSRYKESETV